MSNPQSSSLTSFTAAPADRFPAFANELGKRRTLRYDVHHFGMEPKGWEWMIARCKNWAEVERVLNRHNAEWQWERKRATPTAGASIALGGARIQRIA